MNEKREWLTIAEAAARYGYNKRYLQQVCKNAQAARDTPPPFRFELAPQNTYLIYAPSFEQFLAARGRR